MILALELVVAYIGGAATVVVVLAKYGLRIGQWALRRKMAQVAAASVPTGDPDDWTAPKPSAPPADASNTSP